MRPQSAGICVVIQSFGRQIPYVYRTAASLLYAASHEKATRITAAVLDFDQTDEVSTVLNMAHPNLGMFTRNQLLEVAPQYLRDFAQSLQARSSPVQRDTTGFKRQRLDYALALLFCLQTSAKYCLVLENDALLSSDTIVVLNKHIDDLDPKLGLLRLFRTDHFSGWECEYKDVAQLLLFAIVGGFVMQRHKNLWWLGVILGAVLPLLIGKQYLPLVGTSTWRRGIVSAQSSESVSSLAHMYPRHVASYLIHELCRFPSGSRLPVDLYIGDLLKHQGYTFWEVSPNLVEHVGVVSSFANEQVRQIPIESVSFLRDATPF